MSVCTLSPTAVSPFLLDMDFLWGLTGTQKVKSEHFSVAFKGFQPKAETVKIVDKLDFPDDHPFLKHFAFLQSVASDLVQPKQCIPSPSMLHLILLCSFDRLPADRALQGRAGSAGTI